MRNIVSFFAPRDREVAQRLWYYGACKFEMVLETLIIFCPSEKKNYLFLIFFCGSVLRSSRVPYRLKNCTTAEKIFLGENFFFPNPRFWEKKNFFFLWMVC